MLKLTSRKILKLLDELDRNPRKLEKHTEIDLGQKTEKRDDQDQERPIITTNIEMSITEKDLKKGADLDLESGMDEKALMKIGNDMMTKEDITMKEEETMINMREVTNQDLDQAIENVRVSSEGIEVILKKTSKGWINLIKKNNCKS